MAEATLDLGWRSTAQQRGLLEYRPDYYPEDGDAPVSTLAVLGGLGSGKTTLAQMLAIQHCLTFGGWTPAHGSRHPVFLVLGPSAGSTRNTILPKWDELLPRSLVLKRWSSPQLKIRLINGCDVIFTSCDSDDWQGVSSIGLAADEISFNQYWANPKTYPDMRLRARDPLAKELLLVFSGLPTLGSVRDAFDLDGLSEAERRNRRTIILGTKQNTFLSSEVRNAKVSRTPSVYAEALLEGRWMPALNALYEAYDESVHLVDDTRIDPRAPVHVGLDVGNQSAAVLGQHCTTPDGRRGALIIGDVVTRYSSVEATAVAVRESDFGRQILPGHSTICVDPTIRQDEIIALRKIFPGVHILVRPKTDPFYHVDAGTRLVQGALMNAERKASLFFARRLKGTKRGVIDAILGTRTSDRTGARLKLDTLDHAEDAMRYLVQFLLPSQEPAQIRVMNRR